ncbi:MAG: dephospho-CoA kinase [Blastocatellia bacterium]
MLRVGLTGGIATGKSFVSEVMREQGCEVTDADLIARQVVEPGQPACAEILREFGPHVPDLALADGSINRAALGTYVFGYPERLRRLNAIVHPRVHEAQAAWMAAVAARNPRAIAVVDAALMIESGGYKKFEKLVVVHCDPAIQLERLMARNNLSREAARARIDSQMPTAEKLKFADYTIDTSGGFTDTRRQVEALCETLKAPVVTAT